jgi:hypothetical protein
MARPPRSPSCPNRTAAAPPDCPSRRSTYFIKLTAAAAIFRAIDALAASTILDAFPATGTIGNPNAPWLALKTLLASNSIEAMLSNCQAQLNHLMNELLQKGQREALKIFPMLL